MISLHNKPKLDIALTYDDVQLIPKYSEIQSRSNISLKTKLTRNFSINLPYIASPMDTVCGFEMARTLGSLGAVGCIHRFMPSAERCDLVAKAKFKGIFPIMASIGASESEKTMAVNLLGNGANILLIDVAHGDHINVKHMLEFLNALPYRMAFDVVAGSVSTAPAARNLCEWGADAIRVGQGNGSVCTTRIQTGHGVPSLTAISSCSNVANEYDIPVIADGGIRTSGDIAKALAFGASSVMLGSLLAGTKETPGPYIEERDGSLWKEYRGSASAATKKTHGQSESNVEGESTKIRDKGGVKYIVRKLNDGVRSAFSYSGANNIEEFQTRADFCQVTFAGVMEAKPHLLY